MCERQRKRVVLPPVQKRLVICARGSCSLASSYRSRLHCARIHHVGSIDRHKNNTMPSRPDFSRLDTRSPFPSQNRYLASDYQRLTHRRRLSSPHPTPDFEPAHEPAAECSSDGRTVTTSDKRSIYSSSRSGRRTQGSRQSSITQEISSTCVKEDNRGKLKTLGAPESCILLPRIYVLRLSQPVLRTDQSHHAVRYSTILPRVGQRLHRSAARPPQGGEQPAGKPDMRVLLPVWPEPEVAPRQRRPTKQELHGAENGHL